MIQISLGLNTNASVNLLRRDISSYPHRIQLLMSLRQKLHHTIIYVRNGYAGNQIQRNSPKKGKHPLSQRNPKERRLYQVLTANNVTTMTFVASVLYNGEKTRTYIFLHLFLKQMYVTYFPQDQPFLLGRPTRVYECKWDFLQFISKFR